MNLQLFDQPVSRAIWFRKATAIALISIISGCAIAPKTAPQTTSPSPDASLPSNMMDHSSMMDLGPADADYDLRFIDAMIPHHQGAVIMAKDVLQKSPRAELKKLATGIISAQNQEITQMQQWRQAWYPKAPNKPMAWHSPMNHMMEMPPNQVQAMRMEMDLGAADANYDLRFINAMIPHHQGAIVMAKDVLQKSQRPEMQKLAQDILSSQQAEIEQMKQWRKSWYNK